MLDGAITDATEVRPNTSIPIFSHLHSRYTKNGASMNIENESSLLLIEAQSRIKFCLIASLTHVRHKTRV